MAGQPISAADQVLLTYGLGAAVGAGVGVEIYDNGTDPLDPAVRWRASQGFVAEGEPCDAVGYQGDICVFPDTNMAGHLVPLFVYQQGYPFIINAGVQCSTMGAPISDNLDNWHEAADEQLEMTQWRQIANELWTGAFNTAGGHPTKKLADPGATTLGAGAVNPVEAVSLLEDAFRSYSGGPHLIHVPPRAVAYLKAENLIVGGAGRWYTALGSLIVADNGYPGTGPDGSAAGAGSVWLYGTGPITARLDREVFHPETEWVHAVRVRTNDVIVRAQKLAGVTFMCEWFAVRMSLVDV